jgi:hypothetical protein
MKKPFGQKSRDTVPTNNGQQLTFQLRPRLATFQNLVAGAQTEGHHNNIVYKLIKHLWKKSVAFPFIYT